MLVQADVQRSDAGGAHEAPGHIGISEATLPWVATMRPMVGGSWWIFMSLAARYMATKPISSRQGHAQVLDGALRHAAGRQVFLGVLVLDLSEVGVADPLPAFSRWRALLR